MSFYIVKQYELHVQNNLVEANDEAEAIAKVLEGEGKQIGNTEYVETPEDYGMSIDNLSDDAAFNALDTKGYISDDTVPTIHSVEEVVD